MLVNMLAPTTSVISTLQFGVTFLLTAQFVTYKCLRIANGDREQIVQLIVNQAGGVAEICEQSHTSVFLI